MRVGGGLFLGGTAWALLTAGCEPTPPGGTGGVTVEESFGADGRTCGRGVAVVMTDYSSTNVGLLGLDGRTLSGSFLSSASGGPSLNAALGGDVVFPSGRMESDLVLLDRFPVSVLSFVDVATAEVTEQVSVRTGFDANPQDLVVTDQGERLVSRLEKNRDPGQVSFDEGDDLVRIDRGEVVGRTDLDEFADPTTERVRPGTMVRSGEHVFVSLTRHDAGFDNAGEGAVLVVDAEDGEPLFAAPVSGMKNCGGLALSPDEKQLAVACSGLISDSNSATPDASGIVVLDLAAGEGGAPSMRELFRWTAEAASMGPFAPDLDWASADSLWVGTLGALEGDDAGRPDRKIAIDIGSGDFEVLLESSDQAFNLGDIECIDACGVCFIADAGREVVHRFALSGSSVTNVSSHPVDNEIGLPPRSLGWF